MKKKLVVLLAAVVLLVFPLLAAAERDGVGSPYVLDKVVILSRHNIRSPMS